MSNSEEKEKIKSLLAQLISAKLSEEEEERVFQEISILSPDPEWSDYVFHSDEFEGSNGDFDYDAFVGKIFSYKPIQL